MRAAALLLGLLLVPTASAAVTIDRIEVPERTMADKPFPATLTLTNDGEARSVYLFAALYERQEGAGPCGPATDPRFRTFTHMINEAVHLPARSTTKYPDPGDAWLQRYRREHVEAGIETAELCVFVANASTGPQIQYESFATTALSVRGVNAKPMASFTWEPERPGATRDVQFRAEGSDADGDPITFTWDFGHLNASGRARGEGSDPIAFFYPPGDYVVTLTASDGLEETTVARTITVVERGPDPPSTPDPRDLPAPPLLLAALAVLGAALARRRA